MGQTLAFSFGGAARRRAGVIRAAGESHVPALVRVEVAGVLPKGWSEAN
ncbi:hypothetical protein [Streptomyces sp. NPDC059631]